jgi:guanosine-3',5'-bis(diphosphate) 3'-pyrophosphohydrolase
MKDILTAIQFAIRKHEGQYRKNKEGPRIPFVEHPIEVSRLLALHGVTDKNTLIGGILHDTLEDTDAELEEIVDLFGEDVGEIVAQATDDKTLKRNEQKEAQIKNAPSWRIETQRIKLADATHNMYSILTHPPKWTEDGIRGYVRVKRRLVRVLKDANPALADRFFEMAEDVLRK